MERKSLFGQRVQSALAHAALKQSDAARLLSQRLGREIKPQTIQYMSSAADESALTADLADLCGVRYEWLAHGRGVMLASASTKKSSVTVLASRPDSLEIPQLDLAGSMGPGATQPDHIDVVQMIRVNEPQLRRMVSFTAPQNLRIVTGLGDSMKPTFLDGDPLLLDTGVTDIKIDAVYMFDLNDEVFIKRLQRKPDGTLLMSSDNKLYEPHVIQNVERAKFVVHGRVLLAWKATRL